MIFRDFKQEDAEKIVKWADNERDFYFWSADRYGHYPITPSEMVENYKKCAEKTFFKPMVLEDNGKVVAHLILRTPTDDSSVIRLGFIICDNRLRKRGYGRAVTLAGVKYAKEILNAKEINLGVFLNNDSGIACYKSIGFRFAPDDGDDITSFNYKDEIWQYGKMIFVG